MFAAANEEAGLSLSWRLAPEQKREQRTLAHIAKCQAFAKRNGRLPLRQHEDGWLCRLRARRRRLPTKYLAALDATLPGWNKRLGRNGLPLPRRLKRTEAQSSAYTAQASHISGMDTQLRAHDPVCE
jgi:hypothetical protein